MPKSIWWLTITLALFIFKNAIILSVVGGYWDCG